MRYSIPVIIHTKTSATHPPPHVILDGVASCHLRLLLRHEAQKARRVFACTEFFSVPTTAKRASGKQSPLSWSCSLKQKIACHFTARSDMKITHINTFATHPLLAATSPRRRTIGKSHRLSHTGQTAKPATHAATGRTRRCHNRRIYPATRSKSRVPQA